MKPINLYTYKSTHNSLDMQTFMNYLQHEYQTNQNKLEILDTIQFINQLETTNMKLFDYYYIGFTIPQISKEFDLLRISDEYIVNIELKHTCTKAKIKKQLLQNRYYLKASHKACYCYSYIANTNKLYKLVNNSIIETSFLDVIETLQNQQTFPPINLNAMFAPIKYLISPFNEPQKFLNNEYFLTNQQADIKKNITKQLHKQNFIAITGDAGTGKTLLTYDLAKEYQNKYKVTIIHCGPLNQGQQYLIQQGYNIVPPTTQIQADIIIIDEAQRMEPDILHTLIQQVQQQNLTCIFSYDPKQTLTKQEQQWNHAKTIEQLCTQTHKLSGNIRTNRQIFAFITNVFDLTKRNPNYQYEQISLSHFTNITDAKSYINYQKNNHYTFINYTGTNFNDNPDIIDQLQTLQLYNTHEVIGQEFNKVIIAIDKTFYYNKNKLESKQWENIPYEPSKMLFQLITRVREQLCIVIIDNQELFTKILKIKE